MRFRIRVLDVALVVSLAASAVVLTISYYRNPAPGASRWGAGYFPNVALTTHHGATVRLYDDLLKGKSVLFNVIFTECPDVCPLDTANLVRLRKILGDRVGRDIFFYSISIDPERDTPEVLKAYAEKFGAGGPGWLFLTGKRENIELVTKKLGLSSATDAFTREGHSSSVAVGDEPTGQWTRNSARDNPRFLAARIGTFLGWRDTEPQRSYAEARPLEIESGQYLFQSRCSACHTIGQGDNVGPDLLGVTGRRERTWLTRYIRVPDEMLAEGDPIATALFKKYNEVRMPNVGLVPEEVTAVISYLEARTGALIEETRENIAHTHTH